ncbi:MAG: helix-turn-helix domain-containing protein [Candidatus Palauibacterales bacterium]|nr:helix-turn-helix domain-containing protein [Candidatus Palauibacterales bacterium]MDP2583523.1 helix-turn-helix domain-containing protein [Candidatus Palauibacterales bacterium]
MSPRSETANRQMREASREAILRGALEAFGEGGFHRTTVEEVARRAGVSKGLIYNYFESKTALLEAIIRQRVEANADLLLEMREGEEPSGRLRRLAEGTVRGVLENPEAYRLTFALMLQPGMKDEIGRIEKTVIARERELQGAVTELFTELGSDAPREDSLAFQCALTGLAMVLAVQPEVAEKPDRFPLRPLVDRLLGRFLARHT